MYVYAKYQTTTMQTLSSQLVWRVETRKTPLVPFENNNNNQHPVLLSFPFLFH